MHSDEMRQRFNPGSHEMSDPAPRATSVCMPVCPDNIGVKPQAGGFDPRLASGIRWRRATPDSQGRLPKTTTRTYLDEVAAEL
jgi:hypothetical protein